MRDLVYMCVQPNDLYYVWQVNVWLESCRRYGILDKHKVHILIYKPDLHTFWLKGWEDVNKLYPEAEFHRYGDKGIKGMLKHYIPLLRPHVLWQHFTKFPELKEKAVFYHDCDIMLNRPLEIEQFLDDDINYVSDTVSRSDYMSHKYFEAKRKDVLPDKLEEYDKRDILAETAKIVGLEKQLIVDNYSNTGGAQYLLKNIDARYWDFVQTHSLEIRLYLQSVNKKFFESESKGFQSWCADMWAVLWGLWAREDETRVVPEMSFGWAPDKKDSLIKYPILHNAGLTSDSKIRTLQEAPDGSGKVHVEAPTFYKGRYASSKITPFTDDKHVKDILSNPISSQYCFHAYLEEIMYIKNKYNLSY
jgi:hypothetical protein